MSATTELRVGDRYDIAVVGAGPAGLAAATVAAGRGKRVVLIDAGSQIGGQFWRHPEPRLLGDHRESAGHHDWAVFADLRDRLQGNRLAGSTTYLPSTQVWFIEPTASPDGEPGWILSITPTADVGVARCERPSEVIASRLILCAGGYDRQLPIPGWDLPGTVTAGGVQALLKGHRTLAGRRVVVAGTGPFLLPVAKHLAEAGARVRAVCEANPLSGWLRQLRAVAAVPSKLPEAAEYAAALARHRIPYRTRTVVTRIEADSCGSQVGSVRLSRLGRDGLATGPPERLDVDLVALGWGFTPSLELVSMVDADVRIDVDDSLVAVVDGLQHTSVPGVFAAGETTGIGGAQLAVAEGRLAGIIAAGDGPILRARVGALQREIGRLRAFAAAMHRAHPVPEKWSRWLTPETTICRCEEVSYATVRNAGSELGALDARSVKLLCRTGMGWCQGHVCGYSAAKLAAEVEGRAVTAEDLRPFARQYPCAPVPLSVLAADPQPREGRA